MTNNSMNLSLSVEGDQLVLTVFGGKEKIFACINGAVITKLDLMKMLVNAKIINRGITDFVQTIEIKVSGGYRVHGAYTIKPSFVFSLKIEKEYMIVPYGRCSGKRGSLDELMALQNFMVRSWYAPEVVDFYFSSRRN